MTENTSTITLRNVLDEMDAGHIFSFRAYTFDEKRKKCGKRIEHRTAKLLVHNERELPNHLEKGSIMMKNDKPILEKISRLPRHRFHFTRNIAVGIVVGEHFKIVKISKIHMDLVTQFNGRKVILP